MHEVRGPTRRAHAAPLGIARWDDVRFFLAVLRAGSFSAAARKLEVEQSTVSRRIAALEHELGALLFDRLQDGPRPTALSLQLQPGAEQIEAQIWAMAELARGVSHVVEGTVRLALTDSFAVQVVIPRVLRELRERHPGLRVELLSSDQSADLGRRQADLALRFYRPPRGDLVIKRLASLPLAVLGQRRYVRAALALQAKGAKRVERAKSLHERGDGHPRGKAAAARALARALHRTPLDPAQLDWVSLKLEGVPALDAELLALLGSEPRLCVSSHIAQVEAVRAGLGVALLTRALCKLDDDLLELPFALAATPPVELWLVCPRALRSVPRVAAVWELLETRLAELDDRG
jgi:DNA-binding transcriptional LysR family regulator